MRTRLLNFLGLALVTGPAISLAAFAQEAAPVSVTETAREPIIRELRVTGSVTSPRAALLSPAVAGLIAEMRVDAGDAVNAGDLLVVLDPELEALAVQRSEAAAREARAALDDARRRLAEAERLGSEKGISASEIRSRAAEVQEDEAALAAATAALEQQRARLERHRIRAPFKGVISERLAEVGEWTSPGDGLLSLVATEGLRFDFQVPQEFFPQLDLDTRVSLKLDAVPDIDIPGTVHAIVPVSETSGRSFLLRAYPEAGELPPIIPGMSARATLFIDTGRRNVVIPRDALLRYPDGRTTVWVVNQGNEGSTVSEQRVDTGLEFGGRIEIRSGLDAGQMIVTRGNESLADGQSVRVTSR